MKALAFWVVTSFWILEKIFISIIVKCFLIHFHIPSCFISLPFFIMSWLVVFSFFNCCWLAETSAEKWERDKAADSYGMVRQISSDIIIVYFCWQSSKMIYWLAYQQKWWLFWYALFIYCQKRNDWVTFKYKCLK